MHRPHPLLLVFTVLSLFVVACGDDSKKDTPDDGDLVDTSDTADTADTPDTDVADTSDVGDTTDASDTTDGDTTDVGDTTDTNDMIAACNYPTPVLGTGAIVDSPGECRLDYDWVAVDTMGDVVGMGTSGEYTAGLLNTLITAAGITPPATPIHDVRTRQFDYVTQDRGQPINATAFVAWPSTMDADAPVPVLLMLHGTTGLTDECAPSSGAEYTAVAAYVASLGYIVVGPDFIGMRGFGDPSPEVYFYLVNQPTAIASLDAVRAVAKMGPDQLSGLCPSPRTVVFGPSQGGHAALWVDRLAPYYAPEIELLGVVAAVPAADLLSQFERALTQTVEASAFAAAFYSAASVWYGVDDQLDTMFQPPYDTQVVDPVAIDACSVGALVQGATSTDEVIVPALATEITNNGLASTAPWGCITSTNGLTSTPIPRLAPTAPEFGVLYLVG